MSPVENFPRVTPFLWFNNNAEEAVSFYLSVFERSNRLSAAKNAGEGTAEQPHSTVTFELDGQIFNAFNGGPMFEFTEAISFVFRCDSQQEIDRYWKKLSEGGSEGRCGWLKDKFGVSWQIIPACLPALIKNPKALQAMMKMKKLDIAELEMAAQSTGQ